MLTRRQTLGLIAGAAAAPIITGCTASPAPKAAMPELPQHQKWLAKLAEGLPEERDYDVVVEGRLPDGLSGTLYRNGPGLFERDGFRKWSLLDGDGMIRATRFAEGKARFRTRFIRTAKYQAESKAGAYLYPTWATPAPGFFANIPGMPSRSQAGITAIVKDGALYSFDELGAPWALDPASLRGEREFDPYAGLPESGPANYKAHTKTDGASGDWVLVGTRGQVSPEIHAIVKNRDGRQTRHVALPHPRGGAYFHDFFWADPYVVFHLHPAMLSPLPMLAGFRPYVDSLHWKPEQGSLLTIVDTSGAQAPLTLEMPAVWMWHALNAYRSGNTILADFVGYESPDHFLGPDAAFRAIMRGQAGLAESPGTLRRLTIDLAAGKARCETIAAGRYEFPFIPQSRAGQRHRFGYVASRAPLADQGWFHDGLARIDTESGRETAFHFGQGHYVGEPVFIPDRNRPIDPSKMEDSGWLIAEVLDGRSATSFLAVFDAARIEDGPLARLRLDHHLPFSFHGWWEAA